MKLWFENANGIRRIIKDSCNTWEEVEEAIEQFIIQCNENKYNIAKKKYGENYDPKKVIPFKSYYQRQWKDEATGMIKIDVGSWTEFLCRILKNNKKNYF